MKFLLKLAIVIAILAAGGYFAYPHVTAYLKAKNKVHFRTVEVEEGEIVSVVNSTGNVQPVLRVDVGSFVSGPIIELHVDFNTEVKKDELMAKVDPRIYKSTVAREKAALATREAEITRVEALLRQAKNVFKRIGAMDWDMAEDYLGAKAEQTAAQDPEGGRNKGMKQFLDEKSIRPGLDTYRRES